MDLQPVLTGKLITLRPLKREDFESLYLCASDPLVWEQHPTRDRYKREVFEKFFEAAIESKGALAVIDNSTGEVIGSSRFYNFDSSASQGTIGYTFLKRSHWGGVYNTEMKMLMLSHAFKFVDKIYFEIGRDNLRSRRAIEKIGARIHKEMALDGKPYCEYVIFKPD